MEITLYISSIRHSFLGMICTVYFSGREANEYQLRYVFEKLCTFRFYYSHSYRIIFSLRAETVEVEPN